MFIVVLELTFVVKKLQIESLEGKKEILVSNHLSCYFRTLGKPTVVNNVETIAFLP
jgi:NADH:ubiquinone oxidoreductase subunit F (NADH-binding)